MADKQRELPVEASPGAAHERRWCDHCGRATRHYTSDHPSLPVLDNPEHRELVVDAAMAHVIKPSSASELELGRAVRALLDVP